MANTRNLQYRSVLHGLCFFMTTPHCITHISVPNTTMGVLLSILYKKTSTVIPAISIIIGLLSHLHELQDITSNQILDQNCFRKSCFYCKTILSMACSLWITPTLIAQVSPTYINTL